MGGALKDPACANIWAEPANIPHLQCPRSNPPPAIAWVAEPQAEVPIAVGENYR